jgi:hypothetical protein
MDQIWKLHTRRDWPQIDRFMGPEYLGRWRDYKQNRQHYTKARGQAPPRCQSS